MRRGKSRHWTPDYVRDVIHFKGYLLVDPHRAHRKILRLLHSMARQNALSEKRISEHKWVYELKNGP